MTPAQITAVCQEAPWFIYGLTDENNVVRYVGYTKNPKRRLNDHIRAARLCAKRYPLYDWIKSVRDRSVELRMTILESSAGEGWEAAERAWIAHFGISSLFNICPGGESIVVSAAARKRAGEKNRGRVFTEEWRRRISEGKIGKPRPDSVVTAKKMAAGNRGRRMVLSMAERKRRADAIKSVGATHWTKDADPEVLAAFALRVSDKVKAIWAMRGIEERRAIGKKTVVTRRANK